MRIGMVGLGRMGANMTARLLEGGHEVVAYDVDEEAVEAAASQGAVGADSLAELVSGLEAPRIVWVMVPAGEITDRTIERLAEVLEAGDCIIDGGNSKWTDTLARAEWLAVHGVDLVDAGTSGGIWGRDEGFCLMVGGDAEVVERAKPALETLAPPDGWAHVGGIGAGHFTKMVHNGVEYALMQGYAEGFELLEASNFDLDLAQIAELWRHGSVIRSWLLDLAASALANDPTMDDVAGWVEDSGEGRWTVEAAIETGVATPTIAAALFTRFSSRKRDAFGNRLLAALRNEFGGHEVRRRSSLRRQ